jgi:hypothetical protein
MKFLVYLLALLPSINGFRIPVKSFTKHISNTFVKAYQPYNIDNRNTHSVLFFTGGNALIPSEIYSDFLQTLAATNVTVFVAPSNEDICEDVLDYMYDTYKDVTCIGHSSGCVNTIKACNTNKNIDKVVLLDPVNNQPILDNIKNIKPIPFLQFTTPETTKPTKFKYIKSLLTIKALYAYKWNLFSDQKIPFLLFWGTDPKTLVKDDVNTTVIEYENNGHTDILNDYWANIMHNTVSKGNPDRNAETFLQYYENIADNIKQFITTDLTEGGKLVKI